MMKTILASATALLVLIAGTTASIGSAQPLPPQSMKTEHDAIVRGLTIYAAQGTQTTATAQTLLDLMRPHLQKEEELVFPLLSLLPAVSEGRITADMNFAIALADCLEAERGTLLDSHAEISAALGELVAAGEGANEQNLVDLAGRIETHALTEIEVLEPAAVLVGHTVRQQLAPDK
jgi:hypothetical protein